MSLYHTFKSNELNTRHCAVASFELTQLLGTPIHISVVALRVGEERHITGYLASEVDGVFLERGFKLPRWKTPYDIDCEAELHEVLATPQFIDQFLEPMALDIAGLSRRMYLTDAQARQLSGRIAGDLS